MTPMPTPSKSESVRMLTAVSVLTLFGGISPAAAGPSATGFGESRIIGGEPAKECAFPSVANFALPTGGYCSATLIAPRLIMTAAHCLKKGTPVEVRFGESPSSRGPVVPIKRCKAHPEWENFGIFDGVDLAYCELEKEVNDIPIVPLIMGCEAEALEEEAPVVLAGFGTTLSSGETNGIVKHFVETKIVQRVSGEILDKLVVGSPGKQGCAGDSGGPVFIKLPEEKFGKNAGWRVFGVTSGPWPMGAKECKSGQGQYGLMHEWIREVEKETGIDATPCLDNDGNWAPSSACSGAPLELLTSAEGTWGTQCVHGPISGPITTCASPGVIPDETSTTGSQENTGDTSTGATSTNPGGTSGSSTTSVETNPSKNTTQTTPQDTTSTEEDTTSTQDSSTAMTTNSGGETNGTSSYPPPLPGPACPVPGDSHPPAPAGALPPNNGSVGDSSCALSPPNKQGYGISTLVLLAAFGRRGRRRRG